MGLEKDDIAQIQQMVQAAVVSGLSAYDERQQQRQKAAVLRSSAEVGSPEFAEDRTQINSLNNKWIFAKEVFSEDTIRKHESQLFSLAFESLNENVALGKKLNAAFFDGLNETRSELATKRAQRSRWEDDNAYVTRYDLSNPVTTGIGDTTRAGASAQQRGIDTATVQSALNNTTIQTMVEAAVANAFADNVVYAGAVKGAVADAMNGTIPTLEAAIGAAVAAALVNTPAKPATTA